MTIYKKIPIILCVILLLTGCDFMLKPQEINVKDTVFTEYETMVDALLEIEDVQEISDYLYLWGQTKGLTAELDRHGIVVLESWPLSGENREFITLECEFSVENRQEDLRSVAFALAFIQNSSVTGPIRLLMVPYSPGNHFGSDHLNSKYLTSPFIKLNTKSPSEIIISEASSWEANIHRNIKSVSPKYPFAYEISIGGITSSIPLVNDSDIPNAIKQIGDFLATCKSNGMILELAEVQGETHFMPETGEYSSTSSAIIIITQNDLRKLENMMIDLQNQIENEYSKIYPNISVVFTEVDMPPKVFSLEDTDRIISFLYTIFDGHYDFESQTMSLITSLSAENDRFNSSLLWWSDSDVAFQEMSKDLDVITNLNDMNYDLISRRAGWHGNPELPWINKLLESTKSPPQTTIVPSSLAIYQQRDSELEMVSFGVDLKDCEKQWKILSSFLEKQ